MGADFVGIAQFTVIRWPGTMLTRLSAFTMPVRAIYKCHKTGTVVRKMVRSKVYIQLRIYRSKLRL